MHDRLKSRNVHSEIVFAFSPNNNIGEAFRKFGIGDTTLDLLVIKVSTSPSVTFESVRSHLESVVDGTCADFNDESLQVTSDLGKIGKAYKIDSSVSSKGQIRSLKSHMSGMAGIDPVAKERKELEISILGAIALRGAT
jgi:EKC/KEOPS complex subunit CGI121/TPRKB